MPTAKKLPSGSWRVLAYAGKDPSGKRKYESFTAPTRKQAEFQAAQWQLSRSARPENRTVGEAVAAYIEKNTPVLSPATVSKYKQLSRLYFGDIESVPLRRLTSEQAQAWVSALSRLISPKTVTCAYGLLTAVLAQSAPDLRLRVRLPRRLPHEIAIPTPAQVAQLVAAADEDFRPAVVIASSMGLRRGEISALTWADTDGVTLRVTKAFTKGPEGVVLHSPKTNAGIRSLPIPPAAVPYLTPPAGADPSARIVPLTPDAITRRFERLTARLGFTFTFHSLRHYYDSVLLSLGVPDKYIMARMGHATPSMTKQVYQHIMKDRDAQITDAINDYFK